MFLNKYLLEKRSFEGRYASFTNIKFNSMFLNKYLLEKRSFEGRYASFTNIKFPRGNYQTDSFET